MVFVRLHLARRVLLLEAADDALPCFANGLLNKIVIIHLPAALLTTSDTSGSFDRQARLMVRCNRAKWTTEGCRVSHQAAGRQYNGRAPTWGVSIFCKHVV